jgi:peroxiredoxin
MQLVNDDNAAPRWMTRWLRAAAVYNIVWGLLTVLYPNWLFDLTGLAEPTYPFIWQCVGMIVGVYGVGYWFAANDPFRHWPIVLVGFLGKLFGPIGYASGVVAGALGLQDFPFVAAVPPEFGVTIPTNDLIWWIPFAGMLLGALKANTVGHPADATTPADAMRETGTSTGETLDALSRRAPTLVVFLRHAGCTFCKEALADLAEAKSSLDRSGTQLVVVHMSTPEAIAPVLERAGLVDTPHVSDPDRRLYRSFELGRGSWSQLFGVKVWLRGIAATLRGHMVGKLAGDGFQMPGAFVVHNGAIVRSFRHDTAADRPAYCEFADIPAVQDARPATA